MAIGKLVQKDGKLLYSTGDLWSADDATNCNCNCRFVPSQPAGCPAFVYPFLTSDSGTLSCEILSGDENVDAINGYSFSVLPLYLPTIRIEYVWTPSISCGNDFYIEASLDFFVGTHWTGAPFSSAAYTNLISMPVFNPIRIRRTRNNASTGRVGLDIFSGAFETKITSATDGPDFVRFTTTAITPGTPSTFVTGTLNCNPPHLSNTYCVHEMLFSFGLNIFVSTDGFADSTGTSNLDWSIQVLYPDP
jgi:hypothetical protein